MRKRPRIGDIIEIKTRGGLAYAQFTHKVPRYGALIRVLPGLYDVRPAAFKELVNLEERFFIFFPLGAALYRGLVTVVSNETIPERVQKFPLMRKPGMIDRSGKVLNWWLWDGQREWPVSALSPEQQKLSIASILNDTLLIERIEMGWLPEANV